MSSVRLPPAGEPAPEKGSPAVAGVRLRVEDILASRRRLWLRGRVAGLAPAPAEAGRPRRWWGRSGQPAPRTAHVELYISGSRLQVEGPLADDGRFEVLLPAELPPARRGWRVARNKLTCDGTTAEGCGIVLVPPAEAAEAVAVVLPLACTFAEGAAGHLARLDAAGQTGSLLQQLARGPEGSRPVYYLASVPAEADGRPREVALALTSLGWPSGHVVPMPAASPTAAPLSEGVDRLRWLFAGELDLHVVNLEPDASGILQAHLTAAPDRAAVVRLVNPGDDPWDGEPGGAAGPGRQPVLGLRPSRAGRVTRFPVVFCHGMLAFSTLRMQLREDHNSFSPLREFLRQRGFRALFPQVAPTSGIVARARELREQVLRWTDGPVNLIAHSMGGMDCRYLITHLGLADRVRSLTTIATPHRGTWLADWFIANYRYRVPLLLAMEAFGTNVDGFADCRPAACREFNARTPDVPGISYFSYGGAVPQWRVSPVLRRPWVLLSHVEGPNDGMVSVSSACWGEYLGTIEADHFAQTPDAGFLRPGEDFDSLGFCLKLVEDLAYRGF
jgi:triacylglycerol lipase